MEFYAPPPKPAIIRATELPRSYAEAKGIATREAFGPMPVFMTAGAMKKKKKGAWVEAVALPSLTGNGVSTSWTYRQWVSAAAFASVDGEKVRLTLQSGSGATGSTITAYFGEAAASGDAYDFATTPQPVNVGGTNTFTLPGSSATVVTDEIPISFDHTKNYILSFYCSVTSNGVRFLTSGGGGNFVAYYKNASDAATVNASGYSSTSGRIYALTRIEVFSTA